MIAIMKLYGRSEISHMNKCKDCHTFIDKGVERCVLCHQKRLYLDRPRGYTLATPEERMKLAKTYWTNSRDWVGY